MFAVRIAVNPLRCAVPASRKPMAYTPCTPVRRIRLTHGGCGQNIRVSHAPSRNHEFRFLGSLHAILVIKIEQSDDEE